MNRKDFLQLNQYVDNFALNCGVKSIHVLCGKVLSPVISFVIPTFNRSDTLKDTISSILSQQYIKLAYEVIVLDNSGNHYDSNKTFQLIKTLNSERIEYFQNEINIGFEGNFNRGIELARGKWISFVHDDDLITEDYLERIHFYLHKYGAGLKKIGYIKTEVLTFSDVNKLPPKYNGHGTKKKASWSTLKKIRKADSLIHGYSPTCIPSCGTLMLKEAIMEVGGFNPKYYPSFDAYPGYQMLDKYRVYKTYEPLGYYRWSINVSLKKETILGFLEANVYFREFVFKSNLFYRIYGYMFSDAYYSKNVDDWKQKAHEHGLDLLNEDIDPIKEYHNCIIQKKVVVFIQRVYNKFDKLNNLIISKMVSKEIK